MKILLLDYGKPEARYDWSKLKAEFDMTIISTPSSWEVADSVDEKFHGFIDERLSSRDFDLIFIPVSVTNTYSSYTGMRLGMHLRVTNLPSLSLKRRLVPIVFMGFETELQVFKQSEYAQFLLTPSVFYIQHTIKAVQYVVENIPSVAPIELSDFSESLSLYPIKPEPHLESSHSLANEWGAFELDRLTVNCLKNNPTSLDFNLYIKWLECQFGLDRAASIEESLAIPENTSDKKILFIDDEWDKRWNEVLVRVFEKAKQFKCLKLTKGLKREEVIELAKAEIKNTEWDLILLDLRLTDSDHDGRSADFTGEKILEFIKGTQDTIGHNPTLPVIIFTASTKASIIDSLYEKGADGHFIKHSPSDSRTPDKVKESVQKFLDNIKNCLDKGALLKPYWNRVEEIKVGNLIKGNERTINDQETKFEERIVERLTMFIGLLKKAYEQTDFDRTTFFYDKYEIAFLTLWSVLNELSECYFAKIDQFRHFEDKDNPNSYIFLNPNFKKIEVCNWFVNSVSGTQEQFIDHTSTPLAQGSNYKQYDGKYIFGEKSSLKLRSNSPYYYFDRTPAFDTTKKPYSQALQMQMAFILYKKFNTMRRQDRNPLLESLYKLNKLRNQLYLTHGEGIDTGEFTKTLSEVGPKITISEINRLFEIIYVTTTGRRLSMI